MKGKYTFYMTVIGNIIKAEITEQYSDNKPIVTFYNDYNTIDVGWAHYFRHMALQYGVYEPYYDIDEDGKDVDCIWCCYDFEMAREELYEMLY